MRCWSGTRLLARLKAFRVQILQEQTVPLTVNRANGGERGNKTRHIRRGPEADNVAEGFGLLSAI